MANNIDLEKLFEAGWNHYNGGNKTKAFEVWTEAAELGYAKAQHIVGFCCYGGFGTKIDKYAALRWYQKAAEQNYPKSICYLAFFYEYGTAGVRCDAEKAFRLWKKAAELGDKEAPFILGNNYYYGHMVEQNKEEAIRWYRMSAQRLNMDAIKRMKELGEWIFDAKENEKWYGTSYVDHPIILLPQD